MAEDIVSRLVLQGQQYFSTINQAHQRTQKFQKDSQQGFKTVTSAINTATKAMAALGAAFIARQIFRSIENTARLGDELAKMSQRTGMAVETLNGLTLTANKADVSNEQLTVGLFQLNKNLLETSRGGGEASKTFAALGIDGQKAAALLKNPEESFLTIADRLAAIPDTSRRAAEAMRIFGRSGAQLLPLLNQGREAIAKQIAEMHKLRPITTDMAKASEAYNDAMKDLTTAFEGFLVKGIGPALPPLTQFLKLMTEIIALDFETLGFRMKTVWEDLATSVAFALELIGDPLNYERTLKKYAEIDKKFMEERRKRFAGPGKPELTPALPETVVTARAESAGTDSLIRLRHEELGLLEIQEKQLAAQQNRDAILTAAQRHLKAEIALLQQNLTVQKEIEAAAKDSRNVDPRVAQTASIKARAELVALAVEEEAITRKVNASLQAQRDLQQEILGADIQHAASLEFQRKTQDLAVIAMKSQHDLEVAMLDPMKDAEQLRGQQIVTMRDQVNLIKAQNEAFGETVDRNREIELVQTRINALIQQGAGLQQEAMGRAIVQGATADIERQLAPFRQAVQQIQKEMDIGAAMPNTLPETQQLRQIEMIEKTLALRKEEWRVGLIASEEYYHQTGVLDAQLYAATTQTQRGFFEGWQDAFSKFANDAESAFGLGQTLARNFITNIQGALSNQIVSIFDHIEEGTLTWKTALDQIPAVLKRITAELTAMLIVQAISAALGGGGGGAPVGAGAGAGGGFGGALGGALGGLFGGGNKLGPPSSTGANFFNPIPGAALGGSWMVNGVGGTDRNLAQVRVTRGERLDVLTPAQQQQRGGYTVNINNYGADVQTQERDGMDGKILDITVRRIVQNEVSSGTANKFIHRSVGAARRGRVG